ncbi:MAG: hypothetical protein PHV87_07130, partial [Bacilli bacterium]|nr:hypothetical protein [Bacilli bacterium]
INKSLASPFPIKTTFQQLIKIVAIFFLFSRKILTFCIKNTIFMVALHNGGGVGIGKSINGGFGLLLDGSSQVDAVIKNAVSWDVMSGVARRAWARNEAALEVAAKYNQDNADSHITLPYLADEDYINNLVNEKYVPGGK